MIFFQIINIAYLNFTNIIGEQERIIVVKFLLIYITHKLDLLLQFYFIFVKCWQKVIYFLFQEILSYNVKIYILFSQTKI